MREKNHLISRRQFIAISSTIATYPYLFSAVDAVSEAESPENNKNGTYKIYFITKGCIGCQTCKSYCPQSAIHYGDCRNEIDQKKCMHCSTCYTMCPISAISETEA